MQELTTEELDTLIEQRQTTLTEAAIQLAEAIKEKERRS